MDGPLVLVVRETSSLADSIQLFLETVGFRVEPEARAPAALARLGNEREEPIRAIVIACNQPTSDMLRGFPESFPARARGLPLLVVGNRVAETRRTWPANVRFLDLPLEADRLVEQLRRMTSSFPEASVSPASFTN
jgi:DNA-binding response OmpR family regulator